METKTDGTALSFSYVESWQQLRVKEKLDFVDIHLTGLQNKKEGALRIDCPGCRATCKLDEKKIPAKGATVPCKKCKAKISVKPPSENVASDVPDQAISKPSQSFTESVKSKEKIGSRLDF
jgi:predicted Zn finger-like uncharacterized protein